jgi:DNA-binding response OmpR family regulator
MNGAGHILVIDDDATVREVVARYLTRAGYQVSVYPDGEQGLRAALGGDSADRPADHPADNPGHPPDLVVLDLMLPGRSGLGVCAELRAHSPVPVIMLTALGEEEDRIAGLELGADDYVTKPFSPRELVLRVASVLRRSREAARPAGAERSSLVDGDLAVDLTGRRAALGGRELALTVREFDLLAFLLRHPGRAFDRAELLERVWGWSFGDQSTVTVHVRRLREKLEVEPTTPRRIVTVWGVGYRYDLSSPSPARAEPLEEQPC